MRQSVHLYKYTHIVCYCYCKWFWSTWCDPQPCSVTIADSVCVLIQMYRLSHVTCVSLPLTADSVSFPDDLDYSFQHGLLNTTLVQSLDNTTSISLPPSQRPHLSSTVTVPADTSSRVPDKDDLLHCSTADLPLTANCEGFSILV